MRPSATASSAAKRRTKRAPMRCANSAMWVWSRKSHASCGAGLKGVVTASYKTFCQAVKLRPSGQQALKRQGRRAAYQRQPFYWELEQTTPRHGERPFQIVHIDHTELDAELICSLTGG